MESQALAAPSGTTVATTEVRGSSAGCSGKSRLKRPAATRALTYAIARAFGTVVVTLHGEFDRAGAATVEAVLEDLIDGQGNLTVVLDVRDVIPVDTGAVAVLARAARSARLRGGQLSVHRPPNALAVELDSAGLRALIDNSLPYSTAGPPPEIHSPDQSAKEQGS